MVIARGEARMAGFPPPGGVRRNEALGLMPLAHSRPTDDAERAEEKGT